MDYKSYLTRSDVEKLENKYSLVNSIENINLNNKYAVYIPWEKNIEFNVTILKIDEETLFLEIGPNYSTRRRYKKHTNLDFSKIILFEFLEDSNPNKRFLEYFKKKT